jgi:hypothetical protein
VARPELGFPGWFSCLVIALLPEIMGDRAARAVRHLTLPLGQSASCLS